MDGSAINGFITGGGVIRNYQGQAIFFFFFFLSSGKNMQAEARALITGLDLASQLGIPHPSHVWNLTLKSCCISFIQGAPLGTWYI